MSTPEAGATRRWLGWALALSPLLMPAAQAATLRIGSVESIAPSEISSPRTAAGAAVPGRRELRFDAFGRRFELDLEAHPGLGRTAPAGVEVLRGTVRGLGGSWVRLTSRDGGWSGLLYDGAEYFGIDSARRAGGSNDTARRLPPRSTIIYRWRDTVVDANLEGDFAIAPGTRLDEAAAALVSREPATAQAVLVTRRLDVGLVVDSAQVALEPSEADAISEAISRLNVADGILASQIGITLRMASTTAVDASIDPFDTAEPNPLLEKLRAWREASEQQGTTGLTHLFTGRDLAGQTVGIAYISSVCDRRFGASLSEARNQSVSFEGLVAAHEIGHVLGAPHDAETGSACEATPTGYLMGTQIAQTTMGRTLSDCSLSRITAETANARCLASVDAADVTVGAPTNADVAVLQPSLLRFTVRSAGNVPTTGVVFDLALPAGVDVIGAGATGGGTCALLVRAVRCELGDLAAGITRDIEVNVRAAAEGSTQAQVTVTAGNDGLASNNTALMRLTASPGADLGVAVTLEPRNLLQGATSTARVTVRNDGLSAVSDAELLVDVQEGLVPVAATGTGLTCSIASSGAVSCAPATIAAGAVAELVLQLQAAATATGPHQVQLRVRSFSRVDPQPGNDQATITATVTAPPPAAPTTPAPTSGEGGGGGGRVDLTLLLGLALPLLAALRARSQAAWPSAARKYFSR